jgi:hypothetical protein
VAVINPGDFAAYTFVVVCGISALTVLGAVAKRISGRGRHEIGPGTTDPGRQDVALLAAELESLRDEVTGLRRELDEAQNRLDFTERLLAQAKERGLLSAPKER